MIEAVDALDEAFARHDVDGVLRLFADDADVAFLGSARSEQAIGRDAVERLLRELLALPEVAGGTFAIAWTERRVRVAGDVAWIVALGEATWESPRRTVQFPYRLTGILVRREGRWVWHTHHGSEPGSL